MPEQPPLQAHERWTSCQLKNLLIILLVEETNTVQTDIVGIVSGQISDAAQRSRIKMSNCECAKAQRETGPHVQLGH